MGITVENGKLTYKKGDGSDKNPGAFLSDEIKALAAEAVHNVGGTTLKTAGMTVAGVSLGTAAVAGGSSLGTAAAGATVVAGGAMIANQALQDMEGTERIDVIKHERPTDMTSLPSCPQGAKADNISRINQSLVAAGLLHVEEIETHSAMPEIHGCVPQQAARRNYHSL